MSPLVINSGGNVGIGTTNPNYGKLQVIKAASATGQAIFAQTLATSGTNYGIDAEAMGSGAQRILGVISRPLVQQTITPLLFRQDTATSASAPRDLLVNSILLIRQQR